MMHRKLKTTIMAATCAMALAAPTGVALAATQINYSPSPSNMQNGDSWTTANYFQRNYNRAYHTAGYYFTVCYLYSGGGSGCVGNTLNPTAITSGSSGAAKSFCRNDSGYYVTGVTCQTTTP